MTITLQSEVLTVIVAPERGADIVQVTDRATGIPTLAVSPTADLVAPPGSDSRLEWLAGYPGGWQFIVPNPGQPALVHGVERGFHGESALAVWTVDQQTESEATMHTHLYTVPFRLERTVRVVNASVEVIDTVQNLAPVSVMARLLQHPAFGDQFIDDASYVQLDAATLITDAGDPGPLLAPNTHFTWPDALAARGDGAAIPAPHSEDALFASIIDFAVPEYTIMSPTHGFGMQLAWDRSVFPYAWVWVDPHATKEFPWFGRFYAFAIEPSNVLPGEGITGGGLHRGGQGRAFAPEESLSFTTTLTRVPLA